MNTITWPQVGHYPSQPLRWPACTKLQQTQPAANDEPPLPVGEARELAGTERLRALAEHFGL